MAIVYLFTFPNGKIYVGKTKKTAAERLYDHWRAYRTGFPVQMAIRKYGRENVKIEVLFESSSDDAVSGFEREEIERRNARDRTFGYNIAAGGDGGDIMSLLSGERRALAKERHRQAIWRIMQDPERRKKCSLPGEMNPMFGRTHTAEVRQAMRERFTGVSMNLSPEQRAHWSRVRSEVKQKASPCSAEQWRELRSKLLTGARLSRISDETGLSKSILKNLRRGEHWACAGDADEYGGLIQPRTDGLTPAQIAHRGALPRDKFGGFGLTAWLVIRQEIKSGLTIRGGMQKYGLKQTTAEKLSSGKHWSCRAPSPD